MAEFLKDYGSAIGPTLAFVLGLLALYFKYLFDQASARWTVSRRLDHLRKLVAKMTPPPEYFPRASETGFIHADEARNLTNIARFYGHLLAVKPVVEALGKSIAESGTEEQIIMFYTAKWWFDILMKRVEEWRENKDFRLSPADHANLLRDWQQFMDALSGKYRRDYIRLHREHSDA